MLNSNQIKPTRGRKKNPSTNSRSETKNIEKPEDVPKQDFDKYKNAIEHLNKDPPPKEKTGVPLNTRKGIRKKVPIPQEFERLKRHQYELRISTIIARNSRCFR